MKSRKFSYAPTLRNQPATGVGLRIKTARQRREISQAELGKQVAVTAGAVGQWELGLSSPSSGRLPMLAKALRVSMDWLITGQLEPANEQSGRTAVDLDTGLVQQAHVFGIDVVSKLDDYLRDLIAKAREQHWLDENRGALEDANAFLARNGLWSDGRRQF